MAGRVIQGSFIGGAIQRLAARPAPAGRSAAPGPPPPPHQAAAAVQPFARAQIFEIDPAHVGLHRGGGDPLPAAVLAKMEAAFGADFSSVRIHVGPQASRIGAVAFTMGDDVYFAPGRYQPRTAQGQQLIGHELAHVIQQRQGRVRASGAGVAVVQDRALEAEADRLGLRAAAHVDPLPAARIQAKPAGARLSQPRAHVAAPRRLADGSLRVSAGSGGQVGSARVRAGVGGAAELTDLAVAAPYRERGVGRELIASAARAGLQAGQTRLVLSAEDDGSNRLVQWYRGMGFRQTGVDARGQPRLEAPIAPLLGRVAQAAMEKSPPRPITELSQDGRFAIPADVVLNVLEMAMRGGASAREVSRLRLINKAARDYIDHRQVNPRNWIVLHRLKGGSFKGMLGDMGFGADRLAELQTIFEATRAKYNPRSFGDPGASHYWRKNLDWLEAVTPAEAGMDRVALTEIPLSRNNLQRQSEEARVPKFSAYARELAFLLLKGYEVGPLSPNLKMLYMHRRDSPSKGHLNALVGNAMHLKNILAGNIGGLTGINEALVAFAAFGFPMAKRDFEDARAALAGAGDLEARKKAAVQAYYRETSAEARKADPMQWSADYLRKIVNAMLKACEIRAYPGAKELSNYRKLFSQWFPKGEGL